LGRGLDGSHQKAPNRIGVVELDTRTRSLLGRYAREWVWPRRLQIAGAIGLTVLVAATTGAYPFVIKQTFDRLMAGDAGILPWVLGAIVLVTLLRSVLLYSHMVLSSRIVMRIATDMQRAMFAHLVRSDFARLTRQAPGQLVARTTSDVGVIQAASQAALNVSLRDFFSVVALGAAMLYIDPGLSLIVLVVYPLAALPIIAVGRRMRKVSRRAQAEVGEMTSLLTEKLAGSRLVKTYRLEDYAAERMNKSFEQIFRLRLKAVINRAQLDPMLEALGGLAVAGVVAVAFWRISGGSSTVGDFMGFATALLMAAQPIRSIGSLNARVQEGLGALERYYEVLDERARVVDRPAATPLVVRDGAIRFENVTFAYAEAGDKPAVREFTLHVPGGKTVALVGRSGSGKSTVINLVPRLFDVGSGSITIDDQDLRDVTITSLRDAIAIVSQDVTLFDDTIEANIRLGRLDAPHEAIVAAAKAAAAHEFIVAQPGGYATELGDRGMRLSGGQRQRIALARAILKDAPILLLDEATSALDSESERLVQDALARFTRNRTTLVIAHRLSTVQSADLICVMDEGRVVETGTHHELMARRGVYAHLAQHQLRDPV
jgi:subfamily B ATP-binding cassette protein MsbA